MRTLLSSLALAVSVSSARAQIPGDSARLTVLSGGGWHVGRVVRVASEQILMRSGSQEQPYRRDDIAKLEVWRRRNCGPGGGSVLGALEGAVVFAIGAVASPDRRITGSVGGDAAVGTGAGALLGLVLGAASRGHWNRITTAWLARRGGPYNEDADARADIGTAILRAEADHKLILLDFGANWCRSCLSIASLLNDGAVRPFLDDHFHLVTIDVGSWDRNLEIVQKYGNPIYRGIPAFVVLDSNAVVTAVVRGSELGRATDSADVLLTALKSWVAERP